MLAAEEQARHKDRMPAVGMGAQWEAVGTEAEPQKVAADTRAELQ